jgi:hypothetical protein
VVRVTAPEFPVLAHEDFEGESVSSAWSPAWGAANGVPDYTLDTVFDHRFQPSIMRDLTELIPPAPASGETSRAAL